MDITLTTLEADPLPEPSLGFVKTTKPLLNSNYKATAEQNYNSISSASVFAKRQLLKFNQFNNSIPASVILKLTLFVSVLSMIM